MRRIHLNYAQPGMVLAHTLYDNSGGVILEAGTKLSDDYLNILYTYGVEEILIEDLRVLDVPVQCLYSPLLEAAAITGLRKLMVELRGRSSFDKALLNHVVNPIYKMVGELYPEVIGEPDVIGRTAPEDYYCVQSVKVAGLAILVGKRAGYSIYQLPNLGMAAFLMNIGYAFINQEELEKTHLWTKTNSQEIQKHPEYGYRILSQSSHIELEVAEAVLYHHERWNGSGYPRGLKGSEIPPFSRIIAIADTYYSLVSERPHRVALTPYKAIEMIMDYSDTLFEKQLVELFCRHVPIYPTGTTVKLNTGEAGIVVDANIGTVGRPVVRVCFNANGDSLPKPYDMDLRQEEYQDKIVVKVL